MPTLIERMLPANFLFRQGVYIQTCAQIELAMWHIVQLSNGHDLGAAPDLLHYLGLKKITERLIKEARAAVKRLPDDLSVRFAAIVDRIDACRTNRNLAAHGAWYVDKQTGQFSAEHYFMQETKDGKKWFFVDQVFSDADIDFAVQDADAFFAKLSKSETNCGGVLASDRYKPRQNGRFPFSATETPPSATRPLPEHFLRAKTAPQPRTGLQYCYTRSTAPQNHPRQ